MTEVTALRVAQLPQNSPTPFDLQPDRAHLDGLAEALGLLGLRKLRFSGEITAQGSRDWLLTGHLGATVVQPCVVTLEPVTTRIEAPVRRLYLEDWQPPEAEEAEMPEDDEAEALGTVIDPGAVMAEALALALPLYPRKDGVGPGDTAFAAPGKEPLTDDDVKPFAGLSALRDKLKKEQ
ncbi:Uncharacterized metal-binding protein YceD, DUF177 family [Cribrihabitans marinus]|uniref:Uncharacterized metal-binding protein YceD, DUF177 family n=1 Tax=Cribrihabitans marinus TaxID=1227549 RepID=A0A1H6R3F1_9RHOB|nr:YceD family protein [Cribrihabitans marinus]GGH19686.1 hypothetical protein GCM10010973_03140 [Cribrihabitans marinus]SEI46310.1 Uncharacterized metal-binding protein YceD, DUF177 family [Cribrihabitans marinus]